MTGAALRCRLIALVCSGLLVPAPAARAQDPTHNRLAEVKSIKCVFPIMATGTWNGAEPKADVKPANLAIAYDSINTEDGTARAVGASGPVEIIAKLSMWNLHLLWIASEGSLYVTTVFDRETSGGKLRAVHTRHEYTDVSLPGFTSRPEQYYGECEVGK